MAEVELDRETRVLPRAAFHVDCPVLEFAPPAADAAGEEIEGVEVHILMRTPQILEHPFWGRLVHDLQGAVLPERLTIDYLHDDERVIGYVDRMEVQEDGLHGWGRLVPFGEDDPAREIIFRARQGQPYQASIMWGWNGVEVEDVKAGQTVEVNGRELVGPLTVIRRWPLLGVAVCPYGWDNWTRTELMTQPVRVSFAKREGVQTMGEPEKLDEKTPQATAPEGVQGAETEEARDVEREARQTEAAEAQAAGSEELERVRALAVRYREEFGEAALEYLAEGLPLGEARARHLSRLARENEELRARLHAVQLGETEPLSFDADEENQVPEPAEEEVRRLGRRRAVLASLVRASRAKRSA